MKRNLIILVALFALLAFAAPVFAQDTGAAITTPGGAEALLQAWFQLAVKAVTDVTFLPFAAGFVLVATALTKKYVPLNPGLIALAWQVAAWAGFVLALHFGYGDQFSGVVNALTTILGAVAGLAGSTYLATKGYDKAADANAPLIGSQQSASH